MLDSDSDSECLSDVLRLYDWRPVQNGRYLPRGEVRQLVYVDSDSDCEYDGVVDRSDSSLYGIPSLSALGIDPKERRGYDWWSTPKNGSPDLKTTEEVSAVPKVASAGPSSLPAEVATTSSNKKSESIDPNILERFQKMLSAPGAGKRKTGDVHSKLLPSSEWRKEAISNFTSIRAHCDRHIGYRTEDGDLGPGDADFPQNDDSTHWLKYCFGEGFAHLASTRKFKSGREQLTDFSIDMYHPSSSSKIKTLRDFPESDTARKPTSSTQAYTRERNVSPSYTLGSPPLMYIILQLDQTQVENLVKWSLMWFKDFGFVNKCQGDWLYSILGYITTPLDPTIVPVLRSIATELITMRASIFDWSSEFAELNKKSNTSLVASSEIRDRTLLEFINNLNVLIYIIADYFKQTD